MLRHRLDRLELGSVQWYGHLVTSLADAPRELTSRIAARRLPRSAARRLRVSGQPTQPLRTAAAHAITEWALTREQQRRSSLLWFERYCTKALPLRSVARASLSATESATAKANLVHAGLPPWRSREVCTPQLTHGCNLQRICAAPRPLPPQSVYLLSVLMARASLVSLRAEARPCERRSAAASAAAALRYS